MNIIQELLLQIILILFHKNFNANSCIQLNAKIKRALKVD